MCTGVGSGALHSRPRPDKCGNNCLQAYILPCKLPIFTGCIITWSIKRNESCMWNAYKPGLRPSRTKCGDLGLCLEFVRPRPWMWCSRAHPCIQDGVMVSWLGLEFMSFIFVGYDSKVRCTYVDMKHFTQPSNLQIRWFSECINHLYYISSLLPCTVHWKMIIHAKIRRLILIASLLEDYTIVCGTFM